MFQLLDSVNAFLWGIPVLLLIVGVGFYLSIRSGFAQLRLLPRAFRHLAHSIRITDNSTNSGYRALCTALAATVGTGNLAGVAGAIAIGGPGTVFWMWLCGFLGMIIKLSEVILAVKYRVQTQDGEKIGGPMYVIQEAFSSKWRVLARIYALFGVIAAFGIGNATQIDAIIGSVRGFRGNLGTSPDIHICLSIGIVIAFIIYGVLKKGTSAIGSCAQTLVPVAAGMYIILSVTAIAICADKIPNAIRIIFLGAFSPKAVTGGILYSVFQTLRVGASRGVFTNEAGMGTASIAHAGAETENPVEQGLLGIVEVFMDTIVICTLSALVILCSGVNIEYGTDVGIGLTLNAFQGIYGDWVVIIISAIACILAFATILGWSLYGGRCAAFLWGGKAWNWFAFLQALIVIVASVMKTETVWVLSEIVNALMAIPNLVMLIRLSPECISMIQEFTTKKKHTG